MPKIEKKPDESAHEQFVKELFALYSQNSFGSLSKRELDIFLFHWFRKLGEISGADSWSIAKKLKITKSKAQTLLYEDALHYSEEEYTLIKKALNKIPTIKADGVISLMVDDKYVRDAIRSFVMSNDCVTDLSFSSDVVKMSLDGYWLLQSKYNNENLGKLKRDDFINTLKQLPAKIAGGVLKKVVGEFAEREFSSLLGEVVEFAKKEIKKNSNEE
jgi:hypothetical protein